MKLQKGQYYKISTNDNVFHFGQIAEVKNGNITFSFDIRFNHNQTYHPYNNALVGRIVTIKETDIVEFKQLTREQWLNEIELYKTKYPTNI